MTPKQKGRGQQEALADQHFDAWLAEVFDVTTIRIDLSIPIST